MPTPPTPSERLKKLIDEMYPSGGIGAQIPSTLFDKIVTCKACSQKNRYKMGSKGTPRCGKCGLPL